MKKGSAKKPQCHPNRKHYAKGLCASCYHAIRKKEKTQKHKQPVRVIHTHEVIRQVQPDMATKQEEADEQNFFLGKVKEQEHDERKHTMAAAHENDKPKAEPLKRAEGASKESVVSPAGTTEPTVELGGDGVTPKAEWDKKYADFKKTQDEWDEKRRQRAVEDAGPMLTTGKVKHEGKHNG